MKYILFVGTQYYPAGGMNDYFDAFATADEARAIVDNFCEVLAQTKDYPGIGELWADIVENLPIPFVFYQFRKGAWSQVSERYAPFIDGMKDALKPGYVEEYLREQAESDARSAHKKAIEIAYKHLFDAIQQDDGEAITKYHAELLALGES